MQDRLPASPPTHVSTYTMNVSPRDAEKILKVYSWPRQRPIDRQHVEYLRNAMRRAELTDLELTYGQLPDGDRYLVDGYHRLTALAGLSYPMPALIKTYQVQDEGALARLYMKLDRPKVRTVGTMVRATGLEEQSGLSHTMLTKIGAAAMFAESGFDTGFRQEKSLILRTEITEAWLKEGEQYSRILAGATNEVRGLLDKQSVMAIALVTLRHAPEQAYEFWRGAAMEDRLERDDPRARLLSWLRANNRISAFGASRYSQYVATCWNNFVQGKRMQYIRPQDGPIKLLGTPLDGKDR